MEDNTVFLYSYNEIQKIIYADQKELKKRNLVKAFMETLEKEDISIHDAIKCIYRQESLQKKKQSLQNTKKNTKQYI